jgi:hypothetical protein
LVENQYANLVFDSNENIILGNSAFQGNLHSAFVEQIHFKTDSAANMRLQTLGNESNLLGFWCKKRRHVAKDVARFKHAKITASWDIKPKENPMRLRVQTTWQWTNL